MKHFPMLITNTLLQLSYELLNVRRHCRLASYFRSVTVFVNFPVLKPQKAWLWTVGMPGVLVPAGLCQLAKNDARSGAFH
jgi:hypothetical protein